MSLGDWDKADATITLGLQNYLSVTAKNASSIGLDAATLGFLHRRSVNARYCEAKYGSVFRMIADRTDVVRVGPAFDPNLGAVNPDPLFPEWGSVISAGFIMWCGLHMLLFWQHESTLLHVVESLVVVNGFSAAIAHWSGYASWHRIDSNSMMLTSWLAFGFLTEEMLEAWVRVYKLNKTRQACRLLMRCLLWVMVLLIYWWLSETNGAVNLPFLPSNYQRPNFEIGRYIGAVSFGVPLVLCILLALCMIQCGLLVNEYVSERVAKKAKRLFYRGLGFCFAGICSWIATETLCDHFIFVRYFPGHTVWHLTMAYGLTLCLLLGGILRADNYHKYPRLWRPNHKKRCFLIRLYFGMLPPFAMLENDQEKSANTIVEMTQALNSGTTSRFRSMRRMGSIRRMNSGSTSSRKSSSGSGGDTQPAAVRTFTQRLHLRLQRRRLQKGGNAVVASNRLASGGVRVGPHSKGDDGDKDAIVPIGEEDGEFFGDDNDGRLRGGAGVVESSGAEEEEEMLVDDFLDDIESAPSTGRR